MKIVKPTITMSVSKMSINLMRGKSELKSNKMYYSMMLYIEFFIMNPILSDLAVLYRLVL